MQNTFKTQSIYRASVTDGGMHPASMPEELLTPREVAAELRCSKAQVYRLINGEVKDAPPLPAISLGRKRIIRRSSLETWKRDNESQTLLAITSDRAYPLSRTMNERRLTHE